MEGWCRSRHRLRGKRGVEWRRGGIDAGRSMEEDQGGHQSPDCVNTRLVRGRGGGLAVVTMACIGLMLLDGSDGATSCYTQVGGRQGSSMRFSNPYSASGYPLSICSANTTRVCNSTGSIQGFITSSVLYAHEYPGAGSPASVRADCGLFCQDLTAELMVKMTDSRIFDQASPKTITLLGNMLRASAVASGWRIACHTGQCCFQAYIGNQWRTGTSLSPLARTLAPLREVCSPVGVIVQNAWHHVAATYTSSTGRAQIFIDGAKAAEAFFPASGNLDTGTTTSKQINYDYYFSSAPYWHPVPDPRCAVGQTTGCTRLGAMRLGGQESVDHNGAGLAGGEFTLFTGWLDEVRVWVGVRSEQAIEDAAFEIWERLQGGTCGLSQLAGSTDLAPLVLHVHDPNQGAAAPAATSVANEVAGTAGVGFLFTRNGSVVIDVLAEKYIDRDVVIRLNAQTSRGVLQEFNGTAGVDKVFVVDQNSLIVLDLRIRDPNYRDTTIITQAMQFTTRFKAFGDPLTTDEGDVCYINNGRPFTLECNANDPTGWAAFTGPANEIPGQPDYGGPGGPASIPGRIPLENNWCVGSNDRPNIDPSITEFAPPMGSRTAITYRLVWKPRRDLEWWTPNGGWNLTFSYRNTQVYGAVQERTYSFVMTVADSPEFLDPLTYPRSIAVDAALQSPTNSQLLQDALGSPRPGEVYVCGVGKRIEFSVRARDRNIEDVVDIGVRLDYGLPPGVQDGSVVLSGVTRTNPSTKLGVCVIGDLTQTIIPPPYNFERRFVFEPKIEHLGGSFQSCFYLTSAPNASVHALGLRPLSPPSPDASAARSQSDRCVIMKVVAPEPSFILPASTDTFIARVGCKTSIPISVADISAANARADTASEPYTLYVVPDTNMSQACTALRCGPLPGGLPAGAVLTELVRSWNRSDYILEWVPVRGQELDRPFRVCLRASDVDHYGGLTVCYAIKVRKCQYCVQPGQNLRSVATAFKLDYLELFLSNPTLSRPDHLLPYSVITTGSIYDVRPGDYLDLLEDRFLLSREAILANNPDLSQEEGYALAYPSQLCVVAPTCRTRCLYGTECRLIDEKL